MRNVHIMLIDFKSLNVFVSLMLPINIIVIHCKTFSYSHRLRAYMGIIIRTSPQTKKYRIIHLDMTNKCRDSRVFSAVSRMNSL